ncbi:MAG TPA: DUF4142 domain-containing protein [Gemmatimonadaceae bacterium]|nr:DUF4142 domain-containing protein [Gemmatimonadaceae bacterium]
MQQSAARYLFLALGAAMMALTAACDRSDRQALEQSLDTAVGEIARGADTLAGRIGARLGGREYTNAELVGFIDAYNDAEIEMGQMARPKATDSRVAAFAQRIVADHRTLKTEASNAARRLNLAPVVPDDDEGLREDHRTELRRLQEMARGPAFDEAFLDHEIMMHRKVLDEVEDALDRDAHQEMRALLDRARAGLQSHLSAAEELRRSLRGG